MRFRGGNIGAALSICRPSRMGGITCWNFRASIDLTPSLDPDAGALLNITPDHLDRHGTLENYAAVKEKIFTQAATQL